MKRTEDGSIKEKNQQTVSALSNNYLSRSVEFLRFGSESEDLCGSLTWLKDSQVARILLKLQKKVPDGQPNFLVTVKSTVAEFYDVVLCKNQEFCLPDVHLEMQNGRSQKVLLAPVGADGEPVTDFPKFIREENLMIQLWRSDSQEEIKKSIEFTDCIIRTLNGEQKFWANINVLAVQSPVIYNMIRDLQYQQYSHQNPLDLTELFRGFEYHEIHTYLCFVYNPYCTLVEFKQIISLLKISVKLDSQGLIERILSMDKLGSIVREQMYMYDNEEHPCNVYNVLNFAKQHDFYKLMVFCSLEIISTQQEKFGQMTPLIEDYNDL